MLFRSRPVRGLLALLAALALLVSANAALGGSASPQALVVYDGFDRADAASLGTADTGQTWTTRSGTASIQSGTAVLDGGGYALASLDAGVADGTASVTMSSVGDEFWLVVRLSDSANYWRFGVQTGTGQYALQQIVGNALGTTSTSSVAPQAGDVLSCALASSSITCSVDGTPVASATDSFNATATEYGLAAFQSPDAAFDTFTVTDAAQLPALEHPATVEQGETFALSGDGCFGAVTGGLDGAGNDWAEVSVADASGAWSVELTVPADASTGEFTWAVECVLAGQSYPASGIEVVAEPEPTTSSTEPEPTTSSTEPEPTTSSTQVGGTGDTGGGGTTTQAPQRSTSTSAPAGAVAQSPSFTG
jgi:hypothetical protein